MKKFASMALLLALLTTVAHAENGVFDDKVVCGQSWVLTGQVAANAAKNQAGSNLFFSKTNKAGGVHGRKIELITYDDGYEPKVAIENIKKLIEADKVFCIFQNYGSASGKAAIPLIEKADIPFIAPIASTEDLRVPLRKNIFTVRASSAVEMDELIRYAVEKLGKKKFAIFHQDDALGSGMRLATISALHDNGDLKIAHEVQFKRNTEDVDTVVDSLVKANAEVVIIGSQSKPAVEVIKKAAAKGYNPIYLGNTTHANADFTDGFGTLKPKVFLVYGIPFVTKDSPLPIVQQFWKDATAANLEPDGLMFEGYLNALVFVEGLKLASKNLTRETLRNALESMQDYDLGGFNASYSKKSHRGISAVFMAELKNSKAVPVDNGKALVSSRFR